MHGRSKKLQDYFTDGKVPKSTRAAVPLLNRGFSTRSASWMCGKFFVAGTTSRANSQIAQRLGYDRKTVRRYIRFAQSKGLFHERPSAQGGRASAP